MITVSVRRIGALLAWLLVLGCVRSGMAADARERARERAETQVARLGVLFEELQSDPTRAIPAEILREALGLVIVRETRAGFILGGKGGGGVMLVRDAAGWGAPALVRSHEGGVGLQAGWQSATFVQVLMSTSAIEAVRTNQFRFGVGLRVTSGPRTLGDEAKTRSLGADVLVYTDTAGLYGGLAVEGGAVRPDGRANRDLYGMDAEAILFGKRPAPTPAGRRLVEVIEGRPGAGK